MGNMYYISDFSGSIQKLEGHRGWATQHLEGQCGWALCFTFQALQDQQSILTLATWFLHFRLFRINTVFRSPPWLGNLVFSKAIIVGQHSILEGHCGQATY